MPRKIFIILVLLFLILNSKFLILNSVLAQTSAPPPAGRPTCDLCGWCNPAVNPTPPANWTQCRTCLYETDPTTGAMREKGNTYYTVLGCLSTKPEFFVKTVLSIVFAIAGGIAFLAVLAGAATVLTSAGYPERLQNGKDMIMSSIFGLLLIIFAVFLLRVVGLDILRIPGFG